MHKILVYRISVCNNCISENKVNFKLCKSQKNKIKLYEEVKCMYVQDTALSSSSNKELK